jgi:GT2 family glycosyltransferase
MECEWISGCNLLLRVESFHAVGGFDERYFLYFEDTDLCLRLRQHGWQCLLVPTARVDHIGLRSTEGKRAIWRHYYYIRNRLLFFRRHTRGWQQLPSTLAVMAHLARHSLVLPFRGTEGRRRLKAELLGLRDYVQQRFGRATCLDW